MCDHHTPNHKGLRHGGALEHGEAHEQDHRQWSRRSFLRTLGLSGGGAILLGHMPVSAMTSSALAFGLSNTETDRVLVVIRLKGGNDGLNTFIPLADYGQYQSLRPTLAIPQNEIIELSDTFGVPNTMATLQSRWLDGQMRVVHSVGYPDQNLSHFRSSDIWASGSDAGVVDNSGWLGRYLMDLYPDYLTNPPETPPAVQIGGVGNLAFNDTNGVNISVSVADPDQLFEIAQNGELYDVVNLPDCFYGDQLGYMRAVANSTFIYAGTIKDAYDNAANAADYQGSLGQQLSLVARLIKGGLGTKLYMVTLDGFDTHAQQNVRHPQLMAELAGAVDAFYQDLAADDWADRVLSMTVSEFGRRPEQNASNGTDHGSAAPLMLFGPALNGAGFEGSAPDLQNLDQNGNLVFGTDFRSIYATVLENWLCVDADTVDGVMGQFFPRLDLGISCEQVSSTFSGIAAPSIQHHARYISSRQVQIHYSLPSAAPVRVEVFNLLGQPVATLFEGRQPAGEHQVTFSPQNGWLVSGQYVYRIQAGEQAVSQSIRIIK